MECYLGRRHIFMNIFKSTLTPPPHLVEKDCIDLTKLGRLHAVPKHEYVFRLGHAARQVYLLVSGQVKVSRASLEGRDVPLFFHSTAEIIGIQDALLGDGQWSRQCFAQACEDSVVSVIALEPFKSFLAMRFRAAQYVMEALCFRLNETSENLASLTAANVGPRVARIILHMSACYGRHVGAQAVELGMPLTQQELADIVGAARQTVNGVIQALKAQGVITITRQHMRVEDEALLRQIAENDVPYSQISNSFRQS